MSTDSEILVKAEGVSKKFCRDLKKSLWYGIKDVTSELLPFSLPTRNPASRIQSSEDALRPGEFWANERISFELRRGECIGLIGRNGAGKTTLLKMLNGLIKPDEGTIHMRGRVSALIALGAGFNPILTGRENIYVNGSILGLSKAEIASKIEDIIEFSEVREFIDSPVQSYSSGMQVRLGFAVATALNPDILILDEVLAVGDVAFRNKCYRRISEMRKNAAVIFVSHNMHQTARICDRILVLSRGSVVYNGNTEQGVAAYEKLNSQEEFTGERILTFEDPLTAFSVFSAKEVYNFGDPFELLVEIESTEIINDFLLRIVFITGGGENVADSTFSASKMEKSIHPGKNSWKISIPALPLKNNRYFIGATIVAKDGGILAWSLRRTSFEMTGASWLGITNCQIPAGSWHELKEAKTYSA